MKRILLLALGMLSMGVYGMEREVKTDVYDEIPVKRTLLEYVQKADVKQFMIGCDQFMGNINTLAEKVEFLQDIREEAVVHKDELEKKISSWSEKLKRGASGVTALVLSYLSFYFAFDELNWIKKYYVGQHEVGSAREVVSAWNRVIALHEGIFIQAMVFYLVGIRVPTLIGSWHLGKKALGYSTLSLREQKQNIEAMIMYIDSKLALYK